MESNTNMTVQCQQETEKGTIDGERCLGSFFGYLASSWVGLLARSGSRSERLWSDGNNKTSRACLPAC